MWCSVVLQKATIILEESAATIFKVEEQAVHENKSAYIWRARKGTNMGDNSH